MQKHKFSGGAAESPGETQTLNERVRKSRENVRKINENAPELVHKSAYGIRKELLKWQICAERRRTTAHRPHFCPPPFRHPPAPWIFPWFSSLLTTTTCQCQHILGHSSGQPQGSWRRHVGFLLCLSLSLFLSWPKTFLWLRHIKAKKYRMSFVCLSFSPFFTLSIFAWAQLTRFCYYFDCETINFCDKRPLMAWRQSFAIFSQFADTTTICV